MNYYSYWLPADACELVTKATSQAEALQSIWNKWKLRPAYLHKWDEQSCSFWSRFETKPKPINRWTPTITMM